MTVVVAPKDRPPGERWYGATAWKAKTTEQRDYEKGVVTVMESIWETLAREAVEAEMVAEEEERGEREPQPGRRGRRGRRGRSPAVEASQVYSVRSI